MTFLIELPADDAERGRRFWEELLGVELAARSAQEGRGWQAEHEGVTVGLHERGTGPGDRFALPYFPVADLAAALVRVTDLGGEIVHPGERWAICRGLRRDTVRARRPGGRRRVETTSHAAATTRLVAPIACLLCLFVVVWSPVASGLPAPATAKLPASCWGEPVSAGITPLPPDAPVVVPKPPAQHVPPTEIVHRVLTGLGDKRFVHRIVVSADGMQEGSPMDSLWAHISASNQAERPTTDHPWTNMVARWEVDLVEGALRDDFCAAGGRPLAGASVSGQDWDEYISDSANPFDQRFPNPGATRFDAEVVAAKAKYGFRIVSLRLLRPLQTAPLLVVQTDRDRAAFIADVPRIMGMLDGGSPGHLTFEGFFFEARDARGPFVAIENLHRGVIESGEWSALANVYPFPHL